MAHTLDESGLKSQFNQHTLPVVATTHKLSTSESEELETQSWKTLEVIFMSQRESKNRVSHKIPKYFCQNLNGRNV